MSYDIRLKDPVTGETLKLPYKHTMVGGTFEADYDEKTRTFSPKPIDDAQLNITYNYSQYYYDCLDSDLGIRKIYGMTGLESILVLESAIESIKKKYQNENGGWINTERTSKKHFDPDGREIGLAEMLDALTHEKNLECTEKIVTETVNEGDTVDYWKSTAANALRPLYQLLTFAKTRPDGVWEGD